MHDVTLILTLAGGLTAALVLGYITHRIGLSPIVGYLLAGVIVGPHSPGFVADAALAEQLAELGVVLLMFGVGLQFHVDELIAVRRVAVPGALIQIVLATAAGAGIGRVMGWTWPGSIIFGLALAVTSTVVLVRVLTDNRQLHTATGHIAVGWLVVEDLATVVALVILPVFVGNDLSGLAVAGTVLVTLLKIAGLVVFTMVVGSRVIPMLLDRIARTRSRELFTLTVLVVALGIAVAAAHLFDVSVALGAFLAGMVVGRSDYSQRAASEALPMRDAFAVLFFVSVGMLLDPKSVLESPLLIVAALGVVLVVKPLVTALITRSFGYPFTVSLSLAAGRAQIGEFSFILSSLGKQLGVFDEAAANTLVAVSIVSIVLNPLLFRQVPAVGRWVERRVWLARLVNPAPPRVPGVEGSPLTVDPRHRAVVVGYGPTGRTVSRLLVENGVTPTIVEMNLDTVRSLREAGQAAVYGDATRPEVLQAAGVASADTLILTSAGMSHSEEVIRAARELNPSAYVLARTAYLREMPALHRVGADGVFSGEVEVALAFTEALLERLGATPEQLDRERDRLHRELFGDAAGSSSEPA